MLNTGLTRIPTHYSAPVTPIKYTNGERIIPIETTRSTHPSARV
jgi:hypothetical protein